MMATLMDANGPLLTYESSNDSREATILVIHGAFSSTEPWKILGRYLSKNHLLIPTLPGHDQRSDTGPLSLQNTSRLLAALVRAKAHDGRVHVVGHSLGANIGLHFASHYPDLVYSVFVTGVSCLRQNSVVPYAMMAEGLISWCLPNSWIESLTDIQEEMRGREQIGGLRPLNLCHEIASILSVPITNVISNTGKDALAAHKARVLVIAATKRGALPTNDDEDRARLAAELIGGEATSVPTMRHAWHLQDITLFTRGVSSWIEGCPLPDEFIPL